MALGHKTGGRKKGSPNRLTAGAKEAIAIAAEKLGGTERLVEWVGIDPQNERLFWGTIYPKLLPHELTGPDGKELTINLVQYSDK